MTVTELAPRPLPSAAPPTPAEAAEPAVPAGVLDLTRPAPSYPLGVALGAATTTLACLGAALYYRHHGDPAGVDLTLALAAAAFVTAVIAAAAHRRRR